MSHILWSFGQGNRVFHHFNSALFINRNYLEIMLIYADTFVYLYKEYEFKNGKDLYGLLFNDTLLLLEANESLHSEIFKSKKLQQINLYKQPTLLDTITSVQSKTGSQNTSECCFQIIFNGKEMSFRTTNPTLK
jgi:hypothetical protein